MILNPEMITKSTPKWSLNRPPNGPNLEMIPKSTPKWPQPWNDPQIDPEMIPKSIPKWSRLKWSGSVGRAVRSSSLKFLRGLDVPRTPLKGTVLVRYVYRTPLQNPVCRGGSRPLAKGAWGQGFVLLALPAFLPSVIFSFFTQNKGGRRGERALDRSLVSAVALELFERWIKYGPEPNVHVPTLFWPNGFFEGLHHLHFCFCPWVKKKQTKQNRRVQLNKMS